MTSCQICFEPPCEDGAVVRSLCGSKCSAVVCRDCLTTHIQVGLERSYGGMLPKVRCPICLTLMNKNQWMHHLDTNKGAKVLQVYEELCEQACSLTVPCCHQSGYTHLPIADGVDGVPEEEVDNPLRLLPSVKAKIPEFRRKCRAFCRHQLSGRALLDYIFETFGAEKDDTIVQRTLRRIDDEERRASLLLSYLYLRPAIYTHCCNYAVCFNCKRIGHHNKCDSDTVIDEASSIVQCRDCRSMILKVEGCDSVTCLCGYYMDWNFESKYHVLHQKQLLPVDYFDYDALSEWHNWHDSYKAAVDESLEKQKAKALLARVVPVAGPYLRMYIWRWRHAKRLRNVLKYLDVARLDQERHKYWEAYAANNAEVMAELERERHAFLRIGLHEAKL
ncbi:hypothetical protein FI667_g14458, partial [Globisporangium splendens]